MNEKIAHILTAEEDIEVAKYGIKYDDSGILSLPKLEKYLFNEKKSVPEIELFPGPIFSEIITGKGLYSIPRSYARAIYYDYIHRYVINMRSRFRGCKFVICKAVIPKGSKFIRNSGAYISDNLIVLDEVISNEINLNPKCKFYDELKEVFC